MSSTLTPNIFGGQSGGGGGGAVTSVNGQVGAVALDTDDIPEGSTNRYLTDERVEDIIGTKVVAGTNVTVTYNDTTGETTIAATGGGGGGVAWGDITGTLSDQTDLQNELNNKVGLTGDEVIDGIKTFSNQTKFSVESVFNEGFLVNGTFRTGAVVVTEADLDANGVLEVDELQIILSDTWTLPIRGFRVPFLTTGAINLRIKNFSPNDITLQYLAGAPVATNERIITQNALDYVFIGGGNGQIIDLVFQSGTGFSQEGWFVKDSQYPNYIEGNDYSVLQRRGPKWVMSTNIQDTLGDTVIDWSGDIPFFAKGLRTGSYSGSINADNVFSNTGTNSFLAEFRSSENRALILNYLQNTNTHSQVAYTDSTAGGTEPNGISTYLLDSTARVAWSWDGFYNTYLENGKMYLLNTPGGTTPNGSLFDGDIVVSVGGGTRNIMIQGVIDDGVINGIYASSDMRKFDNTLIIEELVAFGTVNGLGNISFAGWASNLFTQTGEDSDNTGWMWLLNGRATDAIFQILGDPTYSLQHRNPVSGDLVFGMRGYRPMINSANIQTGLTLIPTGNYVEFVDQTGASIYLPTYA